MGKYIGEDLPYGIFERQKITILLGTDTYTLYHRISSEASIIVVCDKVVLQPNVDYKVFKDGTEQKIKFFVDFEAIENNDETIGNVQLHVLYLGKELLNATLGSVANIQDVTINNPLPGQVLKYAGTGWINSDPTIQNLPQLEQNVQTILNNAATRAYVNQKISDLVNSAPAVLDTLKELSDALGGDEEFAQTVAGNIGAVEGRVSILEARQFATVADTGSYNDLIDKPTFNSFTTLTDPTSGQYLKYNGSEWINSSIVAGDVGGLSTVATSGSYNDLIDQPTLNSLAGSISDLTDVSITDPQQNEFLRYDGLGWVNSDIVASNVSGLSTVATSNDYNDLDNTPALAAVALSASYMDLVDAPVLSTVATSGVYEDLSGKPSLSGVATSGAYGDLSGRPVLAFVATSGSYEHLLNKPTLSTLAGSIDDLTDVTITTASSNQFLKYNGSAWVNSNITASNVSGLATVATSASYNDLVDKPSLVTVATSGSYNDLADKPTLASFTTLTSPTSGQFLKYNGSAWVNSNITASNVSGLATVATTGSYTDLSNKPSIPSLSGYATEVYVDNTVAGLVNSAPSTLDTLKELADALGSDANFSTTVSNRIGTAESRITTLEARPNITNLDAISDVAITSAVKGQFVVHNGTQFVNSNTIEANTTLSTPVVIKAAVSQSANLLEAKDSSGNVLAAIDNTGHITSPTITSLQNQNLLYGPTGSVIAFAGSSAPNGWLLCDGSAVSRADNSLLFSVIGTTFGSGNGSTTFNLPDLRSRVIVGKAETVATGAATLGTNDGIAESSRRLTHSHSATMPGHYHGFGSGAGLSTTHTGYSSTESADHTHSFTTGIESANHSHSGTTQGHSADHTHSGNTGTESAWHTHAFGDIDTVRVPSASSGGYNAYYKPSDSSPSISVGNQSALHYHGFSTGGASSDHTHNFGTGTQSANHTHSGTTGGVSVNHSHTINHTHSSFSGNIGLVTGGVDGNSPLTMTSTSTNNHNYVILNHIIKT